MTSSDSAEVYKCDLWEWSCEKYTSSADNKVLFHYDMIPIAATQYSESNNGQAWPQQTYETCVCVCVCVCMYVCVCVRRTDLYMNARKKNTHTTSHTCNSHPANMAMCKVDKNIGSIIIKRQHSKVYSLHRTPISHAIASTAALAVKTWISIRICWAYTHLRLRLHDNDWKRFAFTRQWSRT